MMAYVPHKINEQILCPRVLDIGVGAQEERRNLHETIDRTAGLLLCFPPFSYAILGALCGMTFVLTMINQSS